MKTVILVVHAENSDWPLQVFNQLGASNKSDIGRWTICLNGDLLAIDYDSSLIKADYEQDKLDVILEKIPSPHFYMLESDSEEFLGRFICEFPKDVMALIDNDHGWIDTIESYKAAIKSKRDWLYFKDQS